LEIPRSYPNKY
jgi:hypothetical protein